ncbi:hypothetical protein T439DRAFT_5662 [Meredithblackwellia eburnea MCA 4105]
MFMLRPVEMEVTPWDMIATGLPCAQSTMAHCAHDTLAVNSTLIALCDPCDSETPILATELNDISLSDSSFDPSNPDFLSSPASAPSLVKPSNMLPLSLSNSPMIPISVGASRRTIAVLQKVTEVARRNLAVHAAKSSAWEDETKQDLEVVELKTQAMILLFEVGVGWFSTGNDDNEPCTSHYVELGTKMYRHMMEVLLLCEVLQVSFSDWRVHDSLASMLEVAAQFDRPLQKEMFPLPLLIGAVYSIDPSQRSQFREAMDRIETITGMAPGSYFGTRVARHCWEQMDIAQQGFKIAPWRQKLHSCGLNMVV